MTATKSTLTKCPEWCINHRAPGHPGDEEHFTSWDAGLVEIRLSRYLVDDPEPVATFVAIVDEGQVGVADLRKLSTVAAEAAEVIAAAKQGDLS